ncbi:MAG: esterase-like activity of phytase family protein, partial [Cohnella sp.]|nr:esterase-like activity of phytase family protein [Cohnella sp.]
TVVEAFPAVFSSRQPNRGMEGAALSPDGRYLFAAIQSPMVNPLPSDPTKAPAVNVKSRAARVVKVDLKAEGGPAPVAEFLYVLDGTYDGKNQASNYISDMVAVDDNTILFDERDAFNAYKRIFKVDFTDGNPTNILGQLDQVGSSANPANSTLEGTVLNGTPDANKIDSYTLGTTYTVAPVGGSPVTVMPLQKRLLIDPLTSFDYPNSKLEGIYMPNDHSVLAVNDNDFGVQDEDAKQAWLYTLSVPAATSATVASAKGSVHVEMTAKGSGKNDVTVTSWVGENAMLGTVVIQLPAGLSASNQDSVAFDGSVTRPLRDNEIVGNLVVLDGVVLQGGQGITLKLKDKTIASSNIVPNVWV